MRLLRGLVLMLCLLAITATATGCFGGTAKQPSGTTSLAGTLHNEYGRPVAKATLSLGSVTATTTSDGSFRLSGVPGGSQTLSLRAQGYLDRDLTITLTAGKENQVTEPGQGGPVILKTVHSLARSQANLSQATRGAQPHSSPCDTCHNVAGGVGDKFLDVNDQALCTQAGCHGSAMGGTFEHPASHLDPNKVKPVGDLAGYTQIGCLRCHVSHADTPGGSLTPGYPATASSTAYTAYCSSCHNATQPGNTFDPATHNPGSNCTATCHKSNGTAKGHKACTRPEAGCHAASSTLALNAKHRLGTSPCANCHDTTNGPTDNYLLKGTGDQLCLSECHNVPHDRVAGEMASAASHGSESPRYAHNLPCQTCHDVHTMGTAKVTDPFNKEPFAFDWANSGAYCLYCHGLGNRYAAAADLEAGQPAVEQWPGAVNVMPEFYRFQTRVTGFLIGNRFESEGGINGPWHDAGLNGHFAHWGDEYVDTAPADWPYVDSNGDPSLPDPCLMCHGIHASADPHLIRPLSGAYADWTLYRTDHQYDCHYACHGPLGLTAGARPRQTREAIGDGDHSTHSIEEAQAKRNTLPYAVLVP